MSTEIQVLDEGVEVMVGDGSGQVLSAQERGRIDIQISTAKAYPRSVSGVFEEAKTLISLDPALAEECWYALKKGNSPIMGPSTRLAEIIASSWRNLRIDQGFVGEDDHFTTAYAEFFDLERNYAVRVQAKRRITNKHGERFKDDVIQSTANAAGSIAFRNAVFRGVPGVIVKQLYLYAQEVASGGEMSLPERIDALFAYYQEEHEVTEAVLLDHLAIAGREDMSLKHLMYLRGVATAIKENRTTVEQTFGGSDVDTGQDRESKELQDEILGKSGGEGDVGGGEATPGAQEEAPDGQAEAVAPAGSAPPAKEAVPEEPPVEEKPVELTAGQKKLKAEIIGLLKHEAIGRDIAEIVENRLREPDTAKMKKDVEVLKAAIARHEEAASDESE